MIGMQTGPNAGGLPDPGAGSVRADHDRRAKLDDSAVLISPDAGERVMMKQQLSEIGAGQKTDAVGLF